MYDYRKRSPDEQKRIVDERIARGFPAHQPPHTIREGRLYLLTAACYEHRPYLHTAERREALLDLLRQHCGLHDVRIQAWAVLVTHYHLLAEVKDLTSLGQIFRRVHGRTSHDWNVEDETQGRQVWYRYADRAIRSEGHYYTTLNYLHYNPVKHGLVDSPYEWPWSSVHTYLAQYGREWLRDLWRRYPIRDYGASWDGE
jgi:putative transposase